MILVVLRSRVLVYKAIYFDRGAATFIRSAVASSFSVRLLNKPTLLIVCTEHLDDLITPPASFYTCVTNAHYCPYIITARMHLKSPQKVWLIHQAPIRAERRSAAAPPADFG
jgi:hypothetical protein